jgi:hypothetical protein
MPKAIDIQIRDNKGFKSAFLLTRTTDPVFVIAAAIHKVPDRNSQKNISCEKGIAIGGYLYDTANKCYIISCYDSYSIGSVGFSFTMSMIGGSNWKIDVPMPESVLKRYMSTHQREQFRLWRRKFPKNEFRFEYLQILDCN